MKSEHSGCGFRHLDSEDPNNSPHWTLEQAKVSDLDRHKPRNDTDEQGRPVRWSLVLIEGNGKIHTAWMVDDEAAQMMRDSGATEETIERVMRERLMWKKEWLPPLVGLVQLRPWPRKLG